MTGRHSFAGLLGLALAIPLALGSPETAFAQQQSWRGGARLEVEFRYDDNPFLLTSGGKGRLEQLSAADLQSGRFRDMESATDLVPTPALGLALRGPGLGGRRLELEAEAAYEVNRNNAPTVHCP